MQVFHRTYEDINDLFHVQWLQKAFFFFLPSICTMCYSSSKTTYLHSPLTTCVCIKLCYLVNVKFSL